MWHQYCNTCEEKLHTKKEQEEEERDMVGIWWVRLLLLFDWKMQVEKEMNGKQMNVTKAIGGYTMGIERLVEQSERQR